MAGPRDVGQMFDEALVDFENALDELDHALKNSIHIVDDAVTFKDVTESLTPPKLTRDTPGAALTPSTLNADVAGVISQYLGNRDLASVRHASYGASMLFKPAQEKRKNGFFLQPVIYGNPVKAKAILEANPKLLLQRGDVEAPSGDIILNVTPYECALGAGDNEMAAMIGDLFMLIPEGEVHRAQQYARFQSHIDGMLIQPVYDFSDLMQAFKDAPFSAVSKAIRLNFDERIPLHAALAKFRRDFAPKTIQAGMHFNHGNLMQALLVYAAEYDCLNTIDGKEVLKARTALFSRQVIGFLQLGLPACDRQAAAQGIVEIIKGRTLERTFNFISAEAPNTSSSTASQENITIEPLPWFRRFFTLSDITPVTVTVDTSAVVVNPSCRGLGYEAFAWGYRLRESCLSKSPAQVWHQRLGQFVKDKNSKLAGLNNPKTTDVPALRIAK